MVGAGGFVCTSGLGKGTSGVPPGGGGEVGFAPTAPVLHMNRFRLLRNPAEESLKSYIVRFRVDFLFRVHECQGLGSRYFLL